MSPKPTEPRSCTRCGTPDLTEGCPQCTQAWERRRDVSAMTPQERVDELNSWGGTLEIDFDKVHQRIEELVGRPVLTHEMATSNWDYLVHEILTGNRLGLDGIMAKIPHDKTVIPVMVSDEPA